MGGDHGTKHTWEVRVNSGGRARVAAGDRESLCTPGRAGGCPRRVLDMDTVLRETGAEYR